MEDLVLSVVTPERSIVSAETVESIVLPGDVGQLTILPGHTNFITALRHGTFAYRVKGEWQVAFLSGGFTQVFNGKVTVLAETMEMAAELDVAKAEMEIQEITSKLNALKVGSEEYSALSVQKDLAHAKLKAAQKKIH